MRGRRARKATRMGVLWARTLLVAHNKNGANMATEGCLFVHPPSARTRAAFACHNVPDNSVAL